MTRFDRAAEWSGGRNYYLAEWGDYEPSSGYTFERRFNRFLKAVIWITERKRRPHGFTMNLEYGSCRYTALVGKCRTLKSAKEQSDQSILDGECFKELSKQVTRGDSASEVYKLVEGKYEPLCSLFECFSGWCLGAGVLNYPSGDYVKVDSRGKAWNTEVRAGTTVSRTLSEEELKIFKEDLSGQAIQQTPLA